MPSLRRPFVPLLVFLLAIVLAWTATRLQAQYLPPVSVVWYQSAGQGLYGTVIKLIAFNRCFYQFTAPPDPAGLLTAGPAIEAACAIPPGTETFRLAAVGTAPIWQDGSNQATRVLMLAIEGRCFVWLQGRLSPAGLVQGGGSIVEVSSCPASALSGLRR